MQSVRSREKFTVLILLAVSTTVSVFAHDFGTLTGSSDSGEQGSRLMMAAALAGSLIAVLMLLSPGKTHQSLWDTLKASWPQLAGLAALVCGYALILQALGFFLATSLFLAAGDFLLGERRWWPLFVMSVPVAAALQFAMHGVFGIALTDPVVHALGLLI